MWKKLIIENFKKKYKIINDISGIWITPDLWHIKPVHQHVTKTYKRIYLLNYNRMRRYDVIKYMRFVYDCSVARGRLAVYASVVVDAVGSSWWSSGFVSGLDAVSKRVRRRHVILRPSTATSLTPPHCRCQWRTHALSGPGWLKWSISKVAAIDTPFWVK